MAADGLLGAAATFTLRAAKGRKELLDEAGVKLVTLSNYTELITLAEVEGCVSPEGLALFEKF